MSDLSLFFGKFLRHGTKIASLAPSSPWLSRATIRNVDWANARAVVELGAGTGPITRAIAERAHPDCRVVVMERDHDFAQILKDRFGGRPNFDVIEGDCRDLAAILAERGIGRVDAVVSGLPVPSFPKDLQADLFRAIRGVLAPGGTYSQITELAFVYMSLYKRYFDEVRFVFEPRNLPPAGAYHCRGLKEI